MPANNRNIIRVLPSIQRDKLYAELDARGWKRTQAHVGAEIEADVDSTWHLDGIAAYVSWIDDRELSEHFYGVVYGPEAKKALDRLAVDAWLITPERGIASIQHATTVDQLGTAARALGLLACGPFNKDVFDVLSGMLTCGNRDLQMDALTAVMFSAWPQFEPVVARLTQDEGTDEDVRAEAAEVVEVQRKSDWNSELR